MQSRLMAPSRLSSGDAIAIDPKEEIIRYCHAYKQEFPSVEGVGIRDKKVLVTRCSVWHVVWSSSPWRLDVQVALRLDGQSAKWATSLEDLEEWR